MIVVEGCDGTGKTTLVNRLSEELGLRVGVRGTPNRDELYRVTREDTYRALGHAVSGHEQPFIWDRLGPFSDPIYSKIMDRNCAFHIEEMRHCREIMKAIRAPVIVCHVPLDVARENAGMAHQMKGVDDNFEVIWSLYEKLKDVIALDWGGEVYNYRREGDYEKVKEHVETYLIRRRIREWH